MIVETTGHFYAVLGSTLMIVSGIIYKSYRLIKEDVYTDRLREVALAKVETTPLEYKIKEIHTIIREMEMSSEP